MNKEIESKINITDAQIAAFYAAHKADFNLIEPQYHLAQIVVHARRRSNPTICKTAKPTSDADAKKKISPCYNQLESGAGFCDAWR